VNALVIGVLILRSTGFPGWLGHLMTAAGVVYLAGSTLRFAAPDLGLLFQPAYLVAVVARCRSRSFSSRAAFWSPRRTGWWVMRDSNPRHLRCERSALPLS
jgi:hypothetical protein